MAAANGDPNKWNEMKWEDVDNTVQQAKCGATGKHNIIISHVFHSYFNFAIIFWGKLNQLLSNG